MKADYSDALRELDEVAEVGRYARETADARFGPEIDMRQFYDGKGAILDHMAFYRAKDHNRQRARLIKLMLDGMDYDEAVTTCDNEDAEVARARGATPRKFGAVALSQDDQTKKHLRQVALKAIRIHEKDGTPMHMEWATDIQKLYEYAGDRPSAAHSFGCTDHRLGFVPGNVRWQTRDDVLMAMGRRLVEYNGRNVSLSQLAKYTGVNVGTIRARYEAGVRGPDLWNDKRLNGKYVVDFGGVAMTLAEAARRFGIHQSTLRARIQCGAKGDALFSRPERGTPLKERGEARAPMQWADDVIVEKK